MLRRMAAVFAVVRIALAADRIHSRPMAVVASLSSIISPGGVMFGRTLGQRTNLWFVALVAVVTLALAGCGDRSGSMSGASGPELSEFGGSTAAGGADLGSGPIDPAHAPPGGMPAPGSQLDPAAPAGGSPGLGAGPDGVLGTADDVGGETQAAAGPDGQAGTADDSLGDTGPAGAQTGPTGNAGDPLYPPHGPVASTDIVGFEQVNDGSTVQSAFAGAVRGCAENRPVNDCVKQAAWVFSQVRIEVSTKPNPNNQETGRGCSGGWSTNEKGEVTAVEFTGPDCTHEALEAEHEKLLEAVNSAIRANGPDGLADLEPPPGEIEELPTGRTWEQPATAPATTNDVEGVTGTTCPQGTADCPPARNTDQSRVGLRDAPPPVASTLPPPAPPTTEPQPEPAREPEPEPAPEPEPVPEPEPQDEEDPGGEDGEEPSEEQGGEDSGDGQSDGSDD
jgi:hypothetical protein